MEHVWRGFKEKGLGMKKSSMMYKVGLLSLLLMVSDKQLVLMAQKKVVDPEVARERMRLIQERKKQGQDTDNKRKDLSVFRDNMDTDSKHASKTMQGHYADMIEILTTEKDDLTARLANMRKRDKEALEPNNIGSHKLSSSEERRKISDRIIEIEDEIEKYSKKR